MAAKKGLVTQEVVSSPAMKDYASQAQQLDRQIRAAVKEAQSSVTALGRLLARMKEERLWQYLPDKYRRWEDYVEAVLGPKARSTLYETLSVHALTQGSNPIASDVIDRMGIKKAHLLSRLEPSQRTAEVIKRVAEANGINNARKIVQETINEALPPEERREACVLFARQLPASVVAMIQEIEEDAQYMSGIRDGATDWTLKAKLHCAVWTNFRANHEDEIEEGRKYRLATEANGGQSPDLDQGKQQAKHQKTDHVNAEHGFDPEDLPEEFL